MIFYRLIKTAHASEAWTGYGAKQYGGRWNHKGYPAIYVSTSIIIPSSIIPAENNAILNPNHPGFTPCLSGTRELPFFFDRRLMK
ncbi:RES family NAD+ phosphorylase [Brenneria corticis]|uniref:RES domain-containing protein n=1 Tax=Brenneria corticis TaxID=2173106 RepID=A0A2U1U5S5_9GAMM|nr:RES domain-containing protein [Brenneria sp. CFCC 11842]PWC16924.1 hypothetical protein DDT56_09340 [Brenneria sp. CFCC 11842]